MGDAIEQAGWLRNSVGVRALDAGVLRVLGPERREWLQGQVTNDVHAIAPGEATYTFVVDVRGKILSDAFVLGREDSLDLVLPRSRLGLIAGRFDKYIVMEDVELERPIASIVTAQGPMARELGGFPCDRLGSGGVDIVGGSLPELAERARALGGGPVEEDGWRLARLRAGRPELDLDFDETHYPQETGLDPIAVSFVKGCYVGQEVVCMLQNRGQLRRRMVQLFGEVEPERGAILSVDGAEVGVVRSHAPDGEARGAWALALVKRAHAHAGHVLTAPSGRLTVREVPLGITGDVNL